jgi:hypothetical protein
MKKKETADDITEKKVRTLRTIPWTFGPKTKSKVNPSMARRKCHRSKPYWPDFPCFSSYVFVFLLPTTRSRMGI